MKNEKLRVFTIATGVTFVRLLLVPVIMSCLYHGQWRWAAVFFIAAGLTDCLDGFIARRYNQATTFGAFFDALTDKILMVGIWGMLLIVRFPFHLPMYPLWFLLGKELLIVFGVVWLWALRRPVTIRPAVVGKTTGVIAMSVTGWAMLAAGFGFVFLPASLWVAAGCAVFGLIGYAWQFIELVIDGRP